MWAFAGLAAYVGMQVAKAAVVRVALPPTTVAQIGGSIMVVAGIYELTPLKDVCLSKCREPIDFIVTEWRGGATSELELGMLHGAYCLGCCWRALRYGWRACALWCAGGYVTPTPSYLPARWRLGYARNADDDACREVADPIWDTGSPNVRF